MSQQNVYNVLKRKKKWMTSKEISNNLKLSMGSVTVALNKLFKQMLILRKYSRPPGSLFGGLGPNPYLWKIK